MIGLAIALLLASSPITDVPPPAPKPVPTLVTPYGVLPVPNEACDVVGDGELYIFVAPDGTYEVSGISCVYAVKYWLEERRRQLPKA